MPRKSYDVLVVGGGLVGLAIALRLLDRRPATRLMLIEEGGRARATPRSRGSSVGGTDTGDVGIVGTGESGQAIVEEFEVADGDRDRIASLSVSLREILTRSGVEKNVALGALAETSLLTIRALETVE